MNEQETQSNASSSGQLEKQESIPISTSIKGDDKKVEQNKTDTLDLSTETKEPLSSSMNPTKAETSNIPIEKVETSTTWESVEKSPSSTLTSGLSYPTKPPTAKTWETAAKAKTSTTNNKTTWETVGKSSNSSSNEQAWENVRQKDVSKEWQVKSSTNKSMASRLTRQRQQQAHITNTISPNGWSSVTRGPGSNLQPGLSQRAISANSSKNLGASGASDWRDHTLSRNISGSSRSMASPSTSTTSGWPSLGGEDSKSVTDKVEAWPSLGSTSSKGIKGSAPQSVVSNASQGPWVKKASPSQNAWGKGK